MDSATYRGLVEIYDNQIYHEEHCPSCKKSGEVVCKNRPKTPADFSLEDEYSKHLINWIIDADEDLDTFFEKKRSFGESSVREGDE